MAEERPGLGLVEHCPDETCAANHRCREYPLYEERCPIYGEADFTGEWKKRVESISVELAEAITARDSALTKLRDLEAENAQLRADALAKVKEVFERSRLTKQRAARSTQQEVLHE